MTTDLDSLPKPAKKLPDEAKEIWVAAYNQDFGWRCQEAHAEKAAWRTIRTRYEQNEEGDWVPRG